MKKQLVVLAALVAVLVCLSIAIVYSNNRQARAKAAQTSEVKSLQKELLKQKQVTYTHDSVNQANIKNAADQILALQQQKTALCTQIKAAKLVQSLCN